MRNVRLYQTGIIMYYKFYLSIASILQNFHNKLKQKSSSLILIYNLYIISIHWTALFIFYFQTNSQQFYYLNTIYTGSTEALRLPANYSKYFKFSKFQRFPFPRAAAQPYNYHRHDRQLQQLPQQQAPRTQ